MKFILISLLFSIPLFSGETLKLLPVPLVRQATEYSCGPAAMLSVLLYWQVADMGEQSLYAPLKATEKEGVDPINMEIFAKQMGLKAELKEKQTLQDLEAALLRGDTPIVDYQAWAVVKPEGGYKNAWEEGHYSVLIGMDAKRLYFMDPALPARYGSLEKQDFLDRWHDYEIREGKKVENYQVAIYIHGEKKPLKQIPAPIGQIE